MNPIRMIRKTIIRRRVKKAVRMWVKETSDAFEQLGRTPLGRKMSEVELPGYVPHDSLTGWWIESGPTYAQRVKDESHAKR